MKNYYKIHEISKLYHIGQDSIRYYEEIGLIYPKRDTNNYRIYSISELYRLNVIRDLLALGFSTNRIRQYLDERSIDNTLNLLDEEQLAILAQKKQLDQKLQDVLKRKEEILKATHIDKNKILIKSFPARKCLILKDKIEKDEDIDTLLVKLSSTLEQDPFIIGNCETGSFLEIDHESKPHFSSVFIVTEEDSYDFLLPNGEYLSITYQGKADQEYQHFFQLQKFMEEHQCKALGPFMEFLLIDIHETRHSEEYITELQVLIKSSS